MTIQTAIINEMKVLPNIDPEFEINRRIQFIKNMMLKNCLSQKRNAIILLPEI